MKKSLSSVLLAPLVTEKTSRSSDVAFWVRPDANKFEIKKAIEHFFPEVKVKSVRTSIKARDHVRFGSTEGRRNKRKKAYITLSEGKEISFAEFEA